MLHRNQYMKFIRRGSALLLLITPILLCSCRPQGDSNMKYIEHTENAAIIGPDKEFTLEDCIHSANNLLAAVNDSYEKMNTAAGESSDESAKEAASKVISQYGARIEELNKEDFSTWSEEDLSALTTELSYIITAIREVRDLLTL